MTNPLIYQRKTILGKSSKVQPIDHFRSSLKSHPLWVNLYITEPIPYHITVVDQMTAPIVCVQSIYLSDKETSSGQTTRPPKYVISADIVHMFGGKEQPQLYKDIYILSGSL